DKLVTGVQTCALPISIESLRGAHPVFLKSRRLWRGIRVEGRIPHYLAIAGPKPHADYFVGVGFFGDRVRARALRRTSPGKARYRSEERRVGKEGRMRW